MRYDCSTIASRCLPSCSSPRSKIQVPVAIGSLQTIEMDGSSTSAPLLVEEKAIALLDEYCHSKEKPNHLLKEALDYLLSYCEEKEIVIPDVNGQTNCPEAHKAIIWQFSLIADKLFTIKDYTLCCHLLEAALELLNTASTIEEEQLPSRNTILLKLSSSYLQTNKWQACIDAALLCLNAGIETENKLLEVQSCIILANASQRECNFIEAIYYNRKILDISRQLDDMDQKQISWGNQLECKILWNISVCFNSINDSESALLYAKEYLATIQYGSQESLTSAFSYTGKLEQLAGHYPEALYMHEVELAICKRYRDKRGMVKAYGSIGLVYASMGNEILSQQFLDQQLLIAKTLHDPTALLDAARDQAESYMKAGKVSSAIEAFRSLLKFARENHLWNVQCNAYRNIGKLYQIQGTLNFARHFLTEAMHHAADCGMKNEKIDAEMHLARVLQILGYFEEARKHSKEVVIYYEKLIDTSYHYDIHPSVAVTKQLKTCCRDLQDVLVKLKRYEEALEIAELSRSRVYFNVLKRKNAKSNKTCEDVMPLTYTRIKAALKDLARNCVILYYALSAEGFHLWMMTPERGIVKFTSQDSLASCPIETLVKDCVRSLSITNKGNRCCYDSENRIIILKQAEKNRLTKSSRAGSGSSGSAIVNKVMGDKNNVQIHGNDETVDDIIPLNAVLKENMTNLVTTDESSISTKRNAEDSLTVGVCDTPKPQFSLKHRKESTPDSGYESCLSRNMHSRDENDNYKSIDINQPAQPELQHRYPLRNGNVDGKGTVFRTQLAQEPLCDKLLKDLFRRLLGQVEHLLSDLGESTRVVFVPDGILNMVPFHLLLNKNKEPLHASLYVSILPCLAVLARHSMKVDDLSTSIAIGNSSLNSAMFRNINGDVLSQESDNSKEELNLVSRLLGIRSISGMEATKDALLNILPDVGIAYIASYGSMSNRFLVLAPNNHREYAVAEDSSYIFDMKDLSHLELKAKLIILSGCNQCPHGLAEEDNFSFDLAAGFIGAGADAVVIFLYSVPHTTRLFIIHRLFRLLEMGNSVCQALRIIYNEMSASDDMSHPGYWGGVILVGKDIFIDIRTVRRKALEHTVDKSTQHFRKSVSIEDNKVDIDDFNPAIKATLLQAVLAAVLAEKSSKMALKSIASLITLSREEILGFAEQTDRKKLPAIKIGDDLLALDSIKKLLDVLGYRLERSLEEKDVTFALLPCCIDDVLGRTLSLVQSLQAIQSVSDKATFSLSRCLADLGVDGLSTLADTIGTLHSNPDKHVFTTDLGVCSLWVSPRIKRFLQDIGLFEINTSLFLRNGHPYEQLQTFTGELISTLIAMYEDGKQMMEQLTARKLKKPMPWMTRKPNRNENKAKNVLAKRICKTKEEFKALNEIGRQWHDATLQSINSAAAQKIEIGNENKEEIVGERYCHGILKVKVKQGGTPSSCRFPIIEKRNVTKYERHRQRENMELEFLEKKKALSRRKMLEIYKSFVMSDL